MNEIYIDVGFGESRVAVMDEGELAEIYIEREGTEGVAGNIYKGRVENVLPGMQAAFVNIGLEKNAFLYVKDAIDYGALNKSGNNLDDVSISDVLKEGQEILVQVSKEPAGTKGPRVTTHIALPGRYLVLMPEVDYIGISRRIERDSERQRLRDIMCNLKPRNMGLIVRTESEGKEKEEFEEDFEFLYRLWERIRKDGAKTGAPKLVHRDMDLVYRSIRDLFNRDTKKVVINDKVSYKKAMELVELYSPGMKNRLELYDAGANIMGFYGIEEKIQKALAQKVWLKSGGYLIIDQTEALTSIDVNTGKFTGSYDLKDTILHTNMEAAAEIARQLRLRDIGGIVIIDFIDMNSEDHRQKVLEVLKLELKKDRTKSSVLGITELGLVEMTRKKIGKRLSSIMQKHCPSCGGSGRVLKEETVAGRAGREIERIFKETAVKVVLVEVNDSIARYFEGPGSEYINWLKETYGREIVIKGIASLDYEDMKFKLLNDMDAAKESTRMLDIGDRVEVNAVKSKFLNASDRVNLFNGRIADIYYDENGKPNKITIDICY